MDTPTAYQYETRMMTRPTLQLELEHLYQILEGNLVKSPSEMKQLHYEFGLIRHLVRELHRRDYTIDISVEDTDDLAVLNLNSRQVAIPVRLTPQKIGFALALVLGFVDRQMYLFPVGPGIEQPDIRFSQPDSSAPLDESTRYACDIFIGHHPSLLRWADEIFQDMANRCQREEGEDSTLTPAVDEGERRSIIARLSVDLCVTMPLAEVFYEHIELCTKDGRGSLVVDLPSFPLAKSPLRHGGAFSRVVK